VDGGLVAVVVELEGKGVDDFNLQVFFLGSGVHSPLPHLFFADDLFLFDGFDGRLGHLEEG